MINLNYLNQNVFRPQLERRETPSWLADRQIPARFPLEQVLANSLFYPASGDDGDPVKWLGGYVHSFVYADYGSDENEFHELQRNRPFDGYQVEHEQELGMEDLYPQGFEDLQMIPQDAERWHLAVENAKPFFALWRIYGRKNDEGFSGEHGPERFSLLYICDEGATVFHNLYRRNNCSPDCLAITRPGTGFGGNWTDFHDPNRILTTEVLGNPAGIPSYLLQEEDTESYWPQPFNTRVGRWKGTQNPGFSLWKRV